ncbi:MAG: cation transporter [Clostridia bacterium]|nr:cation transporter [Clostridia bacterium]
MKSEKSILTAFLLNLAFSVLEAAGGIFTGSTAILSDAVHDLGDAVSIGAAYFLEKKSRQKPDKTYTYGYSRYSVLGGAITILILLIGSAAVIFHALSRLVHPAEIRYDGMILLAVIGVFVNLTAALVTRKGNSLNRKAVTLHLLEDVLGWTVVLTGALIMRFTDIAIIDPLMSIGTSCFILVHALRHTKEILDIFLEKTPDGIDIPEITEHLLKIDGILDVHHIHIWSLNGQCHCATMHIVTGSDSSLIREKVRDELTEHGIGHVTLEVEKDGENCPLKHCDPGSAEPAHHYHH